MQVYVAIYSHEYGNDVRVFRNSELADAWGVEIAKDYWSDAFPDDEPPEDYEKLSRMYWEKMSDYGGYNESYEINVCNVED